MASDRKSRLQEFVAWAAAHITGDEKGQAQIFLGRLFRAFSREGVLEAGGQTEFCIRKAKEDGGGTAFADCVWKPLVLIEMKKRGTGLARHYRQAFDYWIRLVPDNDEWIPVRERLPAKQAEQEAHPVLGARYRTERLRSNPVPTTCALAFPS